MGLGFTGVCGRVFVSVSPGDTRGLKQRSCTKMATQTRRASSQVTVALCSSWICRTPLCVTKCQPPATLHFQRVEASYDRVMKGLVYAVGLLPWPVPLQSERSLEKGVFSLIQLDSYRDLSGQRRLLAGEKQPDPTSLRDTTSRPKIFYDERPQIPRISCGGSQHSPQRPRTE